MTEAMTESVRLTVPARSEYIRPIRLVAASLASERGFDIDQLEDIRIAVHELCSLLLADRVDPVLPPEAAGAIDVRFTLSDDALEVAGSYGGSGRIGAADWLVTEILAATADEFELPTDDSPAFRYVRRRAR